MIARTTTGKRTFVLSVLALLVVVIAIGSTWYYAQHDARQREVADTLQPITSLLEVDRKIIAALRTEAYADSESAILESYMTRIRRDGAQKNAAMKRYIDALVNNNTAILALLSKYAAHARTPAFRAAAEKFRDYAISFRDRWQSVFEIFMAGGNLPAAGPAFPAEISDAVADEAAQ